MKRLICSLCIILMISSFAFAQTNKEKEKEKPAIQPAVGSSELPAEVKTCIDREFPGYKIVSFRKFETADMTGSPYYDIEVEKGKETYTVRVSDDGKLLKKTAVRAEGRSK